jgi:hypothetical protein
MRETADIGTYASNYTASHFKDSFLNNHRRWNVKCEFVKTLVLLVSPVSYKVNVRDCDEELGYLSPLIL